MYFNPLSPCGERLGHSRMSESLPHDFNPLSPCGERPWLSGELPFNPRISIHSPHAGRDGWSCVVYIQLKHFNPLSPCGERQADKTDLLATESISIHSPHAGRDFGIAYVAAAGSISIHSPHAGRDGVCNSLYHIYKYFNPLSPCGERPKSKGVFGIPPRFQSTLPMRGETKENTVKY